MNKGITVLILFVVLGAMLLITLNKPSTEVKSPAPTARPEASGTPPPTAAPEAARSADVPAAPAGRPPAQPPSEQVSVQPPAQPAPAAVPPALPKVEPPSSSHTSVGASNGTENGRRNSAQAQGQGVGFFSLPSEPPSSKAPEKTRPQASGNAQLEKKTAVPPRGEARSTPSGNEKKTEVKAAAKTEPKPETKARAQNGKTAQAPVGKGPHTAKAVALGFAGQGMVLRIEAEEPFATKFFVLSGPDRLVVDLMGEWKNVQAPKVPSNNLVKGSRIGRQPESTRLVLDLANAPRKYEKVQVSPTVMEIRLQ